MLQNMLSKTGKALKKGCEIAIPILLAANFTGIDKRIMNNIRYNGKVKYDDVIRAITESNMLGSSMAEAIELVRSDMSLEYYRAVINVVRSNALGSTKVTMIKNINSKFEKKEEESQ